MGIHKNLTTLETHTNTLSHLKHFSISGITLRFYFMLADTDSGFKSMHSFILELDQ